MTQQKDAHITVYADRDPSGAVAFSLASPYSQQGKLTFRSPHQEVYDMIFTLEDRTGYDLRFLGEAGEAFWVKQGSCPTAKTLEGDFEPKKVSDERTRLRVKNKNLGAAQYHYALRFERSDGTPESWDPIIDNRNGGPA